MEDSKLCINKGKPLSLVKLDDLLKMEILRQVSLLEPKVVIFCFDGKEYFNIAKSPSQKKFEDFSEQEQRLIRSCISSLKETISELRNSEDPSKLGCFILIIHLHTFLKSENGVPTIEIDQFLVCEKFVMDGKELDIKELAWDIAKEITKYDW